MPYLNSYLLSVDFFLTIEYIEITFNNQRNLLRWIVASLTASFAEADIYFDKETSWIYSISVQILLLLTKLSNKDITVFRPIQANEGPVVQMEGRQVIMAGSNNYLGLTAHPK